MSSVPHFISPLRRNSLRIGFVALTDAAPLIVAQERGLFRKYGLDVELSREVGWATIREKIIYGELDAAQAPAPMLWSTRLGLDSAPSPVLTALVLSLHGNALTLSERLWAAGVRDGATLKEEARRRRGERKLTFGVVFNFSSHHLFLLGWLRASGLDPVRDVRIVVVPPAQMFRNLAAGTIDGYCAGEPWNSLAVREKAGWCPTWSASFFPGHLEKVLMVTELFALNHATEHTAMIHALEEACLWCSEPSNRESLAVMLAGPSYINQSTRILRPALIGPFDCGHDVTTPVPDFHVFHGPQVNCPSPERAASLQHDLVQAGLLSANSVSEALPHQLFRSDLYYQAARPSSTHELVS